jgi:hypothetical protein
MLFVFFLMISEEVGLGCREWVVNIYDRTLGPDDDAFGW